MYPVSADFHNKMKADRRQVIAKAQIDYTDPYMDQSVEVEANENANASYPLQTADNVETPGKKWASLDGTCMPGDDWWPAPGDPKRGQMGWWGNTLAGTGGAFSSPYPTLTITHLPRPARSLKAVGDNMRQEYPVDFDINLYAENGTLLKTITVTGNNSIAWSQPLDPWVLDVAKQELVVKKWSHAGRQVKILEFFTSIQETYLSGDLVSLKLLEEREASQGSLPVGNISANEIVLALNNEDGKFDVDNEMSPLANLLKANRRIRVWLGSEVQIPEEIEEDFSGGTHHQTATDGDDLILAQHQVPTTDPTEVSHTEETESDWDNGVLTNIKVEENSIKLVSTTAIKLDGTSGIANPFPRPTAPVTIELWIKRNSDISSTENLCWLWNDGCILAITDTGFLRVFNGSYHDTDKIVADNEWHHIAQVDYGQENDLVVYVDGIEVIRLPSNLVYGTSLNYWGSSYNNNSFFYKGFFDEIRIWNKAKTQAEIIYEMNKSLIGDETDLLGYWKLEEGNGTVLLDSAGDNNGTLPQSGSWAFREGTRISPPLDLSSIGTVKTSEISWQATIPTGTSITIETALSTDGGQTWGAWQTATNGQAIPGILPDMDLSNTRLKTRATLETTDTDITPTLEGLNINLTGEKTIMMTVYFEDGYAVSDPIDISSIDRVRAGNISWQATMPDGTNATLETALSLDGGQNYSDWEQVQPGQTIPGITEGLDLTNAYLKIRANLATKDVEVTPILHPITIYLYPLDNPTVIEEYIPLGTFWSLDWDSPDDTLEATVTARDRMELLRKNIYETSPLWVNETLYNIATFVLQDAGLYPGEWLIDENLQDIVIPYAWFEPMSHRDALRRIAEAGLAIIYADRDGKIRTESFKTTSETSELTITEDDYFPPLSAPSKQEGVANEIIVTTQPVEPAAQAEEVYRSSAPVTIPARTIRVITVQYSTVPVMDAVASLVDPPSGVSIVTGETAYYAWGAKVAVQNTNTSDQEVIVKVDGKPFKALSKERVVARDEASILDNGVLQYQFPENHLVQTLEQANAIANILLASFKDPRRDIEVSWRGNPALLLGDRITVKGRDYHVIRQEIEWTGALSAKLTARKAGERDGD